MKSNMNVKCETCFYYSGISWNNVLLSHCSHLNSTIAPGWEKYYEDKDCPEFVDNEKYCNKLEEFLEANIDDFIQNEVKENNK